MRYQFDEANFTLSLMREEDDFSFYSYVLVDGDIIISGEYNSPSTQERNKVVREILGWIVVDENYSRYKDWIKQL